MADADGAERDQPPKLESCFKAVAWVLLPVWVWLLGAPFVVYGTYLRHKTQRLEQEGHITDRINNAVEQLGAKKTIKEPNDEGQTVERTVPNI